MLDSEVWKGTGGAILIFIIIVFVVGGVSLAAYKTFGPAMEETRHEIHKNNSAYVDGGKRDLADFQLQYVSAEDEATKAIIRSTVLHRFADYPVEKLPEDLQKFLKDLKQEQIEAASSK